jgi:hypothetical protein
VISVERIEKRCCHKELVGSKGVIGNWWRTYGEGGWKGYMKEKGIT